MIIFKLCKYHLGVPFAHNAAVLVHQYRHKLGNMYNMWVNFRTGAPISLNELKEVYGALAYPYDNQIII